MTSARWLLVLLAAAFAGVPAAEKKELLARFGREQLGEVLADHILRLTPPGAPTRPRYVVPVRNTWLKPPALNLYVYRAGERPQALADPRGAAENSLVFRELTALRAEDRDGDGLTDVVLAARFRDGRGEGERTVWYRNDGASGFRLVTGAPPEAPNAVSGRADCGPLPLAEPWSVKACPVPGNRFDLVFASEGRERYQLSGTGDAFEVQGFDARAVAVSFEGTECQVVKVLRLKNGKWSRIRTAPTPLTAPLRAFPVPASARGSWSAVTAGVVSAGNALSAFVIRRGHH